MSRVRKGQTETSPPHLGGRPISKYVHGSILSWTESYTFGTWSVNITSLGFD